MHIGIISRCKGQRTKGIFKKPLVHKLDNDLTVAELPFTEYEKVNDRKIEKAVLRAKKALNTDKILFTKDLLKWSDKDANSEELFYKMAPAAVLAVAKRFKISEPIHIAIRQKEVGEKTLYVIEKLIYKCQNIKILTDKGRRAIKLSDIIMREFGAAVWVLPYDYVEDKGITVDMDNNHLCVFGKSVIRNFEIGGENYGYDIDLVRLYELRKRDFDKIVIKSGYCGKNKLTLGAI